VLLSAFEERGLAWINRPSCLMKEVSAVEKHAMALGYFFLSAFCLFASGQPFVPFPLPLLLAGLAAALVGAAFFVSACTPRILAMKKAITDWFVETARLIPLARELPTNLRSRELDVVVIESTNQLGQKR
jgi:hypothetical protein